MKRLLTLIALTCAAATSFGATLNPVQLLNPAGSTAGQAIVSTGSSSAPSWGNVTATALAAQAANTVVANVTASSASPTAVAMPTCNTSTSALQYTPVAGWTCYTNSASLTGATFTGPVTATTLTSTGSILGGGAGYTIGTVTGTSNGGAISLFDSTHGNTVNVLNNGAIVSQFTSTGLTVTGSITPSYPAGVVGNKTGANVTAGSVGEYICAQVTNGGSPTGCASNVSTPISLTSGTTINVASISLTAGDWDVSAHVAYILGGTTTVSFIGGSISTTSATNDYTKGFLGSFPGGSTTTTVATGISPVRINVSSPTTVYLVTVAVFGTSTMTVVGDISARRR